MFSFSRLAYEHLLYTVVQQYPEVKTSSLHLFTVSESTGKVEGHVLFYNGLELRIHEVIDLADGEILDYNYDVLRDEEPVRWYDPQPHPELAELARTFPHHRHEPPDIKHNRRPAPGIGFQVPNLPALIADCIELAKESPAR
jgi:hypothetical protein